MAESLDGTVALVTGASSGIGAATALALAQNGAAVAVAARRTDKLAELVTRIEGSGGNALAIEADVTDRAQVEAMVAETAETLGRIDTLFNNAGVMLLAPVAHAEVDDWERMVDLNIKGLLYTAKTALPHLVDAAETSPRGVADLINVSSVAGRLARAGSGVYNLTKWGVNGFTEALRQEVAPKHVRVAALEPGAVDTELVSHMNDRAQNAFAERFSDVEQLQAEDIADLAAYIVTRPRRAAINEVLIRPTEQIT